MNIIVRLYWQHDLDLVALCMHPDFDMKTWVKRAMIAFSKGDTGFSIPLPRPMPYRVELDNCCIHFGLTPGVDDETISCMNGFRYGQRNSAIKNIFRMYLEGAYLDPYYNDKMFDVKKRGSKRTTVSVPKIQKEVLAPPKKEKKIVNSASVSEEPKIPKEELSTAQNLSKNSFSKKNTGSSIHNSDSAPISSDDYEMSLETTDSAGDDEFDLFSAIGEMLT